ncbi:MAG: alpha/beta hydrolase [Deltaproteobacteria bacterium]|nr:alpha/beta hydrolase [Deltaproteobacteria bacterium]
MARSSKKTRTFAFAGLALVLLTVVPMAILALFENSFIFHPEVTPRRSTTEITGGVKVQDVTFRTGDGVSLHAWKAGDFSSGPVILFCHGNAGNITHRAVYVSSLVRSGLAVFIFDYRGYGQSQGSPDEDGVYEDARAAYDHLLAVERLDASRIVLMGRSLGGAVAINLATEREVPRLIVESSFTSGRDMGRLVFFGLPVHMLMRSRFDSISKVAGLTMPKLFLHGDLDDVVPYEMGTRLYDAAAQPKRFVPLPGADHNSAPFIPELDYFSVIAKFVRGED